METNLFFSNGEDDDNDYTNPSLQHRRGGTILDAMGFSCEDDEIAKKRPGKKCSGDSQTSSLSQWTSSSSEGDDGDTLPPLPTIGRPLVAGIEVDAAEDEDEDVEEDDVINEDEDFNKLLGAQRFIKRKSILHSKDKRTPLQRFRALVNTVRHNLRWAKALKPPSVHKEFTIEGDDESGDRLTFNAAIFKANVQTVRTLPASAKSILRKNPWERTSSELHYAFGYIDKLNCFRKYTKSIKHELACVLYFQHFEEGRVIVKQGYPGLAYYFILSGAVQVEITETDKRTGKQITQIVGEIQAGASFGELALLHGSKRTATIKCKVDSEFLRLDKDDFDTVLRRGYQQDWESRYRDLRSLKSFGEWTDEELRVTNDRAKLVAYPPNTVIVSDLTETPDNIYFIKSGECKVVREITLLQSKLPFGHRKLSLPPLNADHTVADEFQPEKYQKLVKKYLHISTIRRGKFFGVGEDLHKTYIISSGKVECIVVSRFAFLRHERGRCLKTMKEKVERLFPSFEDSFTSYMDDMRWRSYKRGLVRDLIHRRHIPNNTTLDDVPLIMRIENVL